jgi:hypothetical protein
MLIRNIGHIQQNYASLQQRWSYASKIFMFSQFRDKSIHKYVKLEILTAVTTKITLFCDEVPYSFAYGYQRFGWASIIMVECLTENGRNKCILKVYNHNTRRHIPEDSEWHWLHKTVVEPRENC